MDFSQMQYCFLSMSGIIITLNSFLRYPALSLVPHHTSSFNLTGFFSSIFWSWWPISVRVRQVRGTRGSPKRPCWGASLDTGGWAPIPTPVGLLSVAPDDPHLTWGLSLTLRAPTLPSPLRLSGNFSAISLRWPPVPVGSHLQNISSVISGGLWTGWPYAFV